MNVESTEIEMEITEVETDSTEIVQDIVPVYELDSTEFVESTELLESTESIDNTELVEVPTESVFNEVGSSMDSVVVIDCTEQFQHLCTGFDIVVMVLLSWFGCWVLRSWRTWTVKGGK